MEIIVALALSFLGSVLGTIWLQRYWPWLRIKTLLRLGYLGKYYQGTWTGRGAEMALPELNFQPEAPGTLTNFRIVMHILQIQDRARGKIEYRPDLPGKETFITHFEGQMTSNGDLVIAHTSAVGQVVYTAVGMLHRNPSMGLHGWMIANQYRGRNLVLLRLDFEPGNVPPWSAQY